MQAERLRGACGVGGDGGGALLPQTNSLELAFGTVLDVHPPSLVSTSLSNILATLGTR